MTKLSGVGTTIALTVQTTFTPELYEIELPDSVEINRLGASHYGQNFDAQALMEPGGLRTVSEMTLSAYFDPNEQYGSIIGIKDKI